MAHDDPPDRRADERVPDGQRVDAGEPEHDLDAMGLERLDEDVGPGAHGGRRDGHAREPTSATAEMNATRSLMSDAESDDPNVVGITPSG